MGRIRRKFPVACIYFTKIVDTVEVSCQKWNRFLEVCNLQKLTYYLTLTLYSFFLYVNILTRNLGTETRRLS